jgi:hypothetical protein
MGERQVAKFDSIFHLATRYLPKVALGATDKVFHSASIKLKLKLN